MLHLPKVVHRLLNELTRHRTEGKAEGDDLNILNRLNHLNYFSLNSANSGFDRES